MALKGTLRDFGLSDIFQLIALQKKTGILHLEDRGRKVVVNFFEGKVVGAEALSEKTREKERVGDILLKSRILDRAQLEAALSEQRRTMKKLGVILVERDLVTPARFTEVFAFQTRETLLRIFQWGTGNYHFDTVKIAWDQEFVTPLSAEFILMEAARVIDEWPGVRKKIPSGDAVFARVPEAEGTVLPAEEGGAEGAEEDIFGEARPQAYQGGKVRLNPSQSRVYGLVDGVRTVEELSYQTLLGEFEVCKSLIDMAGQGLVRPTRIPTSVTRAEEGAETKKRPRRGFLVLVATLAGAAAFLAGLFYLSSHTGGGILSTTRLTGEKAGAFRDLAGRAQMGRIAFALEVARLEQGAYPAALEELIQGGYLSLYDITYPYGEPFLLHLRPEGPEVEAPRP
jgi:hypothetical protein